MPTSCSRIPGLSLGRRIGLILSWVLVAGCEGGTSGRLAMEHSPYLRAHAADPVAWQTWSPGTLAEAAREQKLLFVSVGFESCHWCHEMQRVTFSDPEAARALSGMVAVLVDREERPDVDSLLYEAARARNGMAGWPLNLVFAPGLRLLWAGGFLPKRDFLQRIGALASAWRARSPADRAEPTPLAREEAGGEGDEVGSAGVRLSADLLRAFVRHAVESYDPVHGGVFEDQRKLPAAASVRALLAAGRRLGDSRALALARRTLEGMARGELRDARDGGFRRYATRADWSEPHREKMLYDQAQLARAYLDSGRDGDLEIARGALGFALARLRDAGGGFVAVSRFGGGSWAGPGARNPARDPWVLTGWNGMMIAALARGSLRLARPEYLGAALAAAETVLAGDGPLARGRVGGTAAGGAFLEDYAFFIEGLLELYQASSQPRWLAEAWRLQQEQDRLLGDARGGDILTRLRRRAVACRAPNTGRAGCRAARKPRRR